MVDTNENEVQYAINIDKVFSLVFDKTNAKIDREITDGYEIDENSNKMAQMSKIVREIKTDGDSQRENLKYDLIKTFLIEIMDMDGEVTAGNSICINTLLKYGIIEII